MGADVAGVFDRVCERTVVETATYSCERGYTRSGRSCSKYTYKSPTNGACPAGYTVFYNGFTHLCRSDAEHRSTPELISENPQFAFV